MSVLLQFIIVIGAILLGTRYGGMGIGIISCLGLGILCLFFGVTPGALPADVCFIILSVCTCSAILETCGGLDLLINIGAKILRNHPKYITTLAPIVMFFLTFFAGTAMVCFALQPVIYEVAYSNGIRPERAMVTGTMAAQCAIPASPISAATAALIGLFATYGYSDITLGQILMVTVPSILIAAILTSFCEPIVIRLVEMPRPTELKKASPKAKFSLILFGLGIVFIVSTGFFPELRTPLGSEKPLSLATVIELVMLLVGALLVITCRPNLTVAANSQILRSAVATMVCIVGCSWMADSFVAANGAVIMETFGQIAQDYPWSFAFVLYFMTSIMNSQAATTRAIMPMGFALGLSPLALIAMFPAVNGFLFPINGPAIAACSIDRSGTSSMGKYVFDNPFQIFGTVTAIIAVIIGFGITYFM